MNYSATGRVRKRTARERVERVAAFLRHRLSEPPSLEGKLGAKAGCSPFYFEAGHFHGRWG